MEKIVQLLSLLEFPRTIHPIRPGVYAGLRGVFGEAAKRQTLQFQRRLVEAESIRGWVRPRPGAE